MKIKDLPKGIKELAIKRVKESQKEQVFNRLDVEDIKLNTTACFQWNRTEEGYDFWKEINKGNFDVYYNLKANEYAKDVNNTKDDLRSRISKSEAFNIFQNKCKESKKDCSELHDYAGRLFDATAINLNNGKVTTGLDSLESKVKNLKSELNKVNELIQKLSNKNTTGRFEKELKDMITKCEKITIDDLHLCGIGTGGNFKGLLNEEKDQVSSEDMKDFTELLNQQMKIYNDINNDNISKELKQEATYHIGQCTGMIEMLKTNPDLSISIGINGMDIGACNNKGVIEMLESEIKEAEKCFNGKPNKFK